MLVQGLILSLFGRDGDSNWLHQLGKAHITHPHEPTTLVWVTVHSIRWWVWTVSQNPWSSILTWIAQSPKPVANIVLDQSPSFNTLLPEMLTIQYTHLEWANRFHGRNELSGRGASGFKNKTRYTPYVSLGSQISHIATNKENIKRQCLI
jgi:hypothetical protein